MNKVIVFGSLNMDLTIGCNQVPMAGETIQGHDFLTTEGGKGANQAVACSKLGAPTMMIGCVGQDIFGSQMIEKLDEYEVDTTYVKRTDRQPTGIAMVIRSEGDNRIILNAGANYELSQQEVFKTLDLTANEGDIFLTQYECHPEVVIDSLKYAKDKGLYTIFNPAPAKEIPLEAYQTIDLIVVNQSECEVLTGIYPESKESCQLAIEKFKSFGANTAMITLGKEGSITHVGEDLVLVKSEKVKAIDTTAAGDTYIGALAKALLNKQNIEDGMKLASKAAALTVTKKGAQQAIPYIKDVEEYFGK